ncbi:MAG: LysR family transcriptional regulator [Chloroflexi bacterium]|nr:LysR family transcriptional regulator [Chloroflexota bacterium]
MAVEGQPRQTPAYRPPHKPRLSRRPAPDYSARGRVWIEKCGELYLGRGRSMLLERIDQTGSIAAAARSMRLAYRNAWLWVEAMNRLAPAPLVEKSAGGSGGGRARLTDEGRKALKEYEELYTRFQAFLEQLR